MPESGMSTQVGHEASTHLFEQIDDRQLDLRLYEMLVLLDTTRRRLYEKSVVIEKLQHNLGRERSKSASQILSLKLELEAERRKENDKQRDDRVRSVRGSSYQTEESRYAIAQGGSPPVEAMFHSAEQGREPEVKRMKRAT